MIEPKVSFRKYRMSDLERLCELFLNNRIIDTLGMPKRAKDITKADEKKWIKKKIREYGLKKPENLAFAVTLDENYIGSIGIHHIDYNNEKAEVGCWIGEPYWGKGYATEVLKQFVRYVFKRFHFKRLQGVAYSHNHGSLKAMEKAGFKFEGETRKSTKRLGKFYNDRIYAIVR